MMTRRVFLPLAGTVLVPGISRLFGAEDAEIVQGLEAIRTRHKLPALAGGVVTLDGLGDAGVSGVRKAGTEVAATMQDHWHIGSMTKAMTAVLVAQYVEAEKLKWDDRLGDLLPDDCKGCAPGVEAITVQQLLRHKSGLPANVGWWLLPPEWRDRLLRTAAPASGPAILPGKAFLYSNVGYVVLGRVLEDLSGETWEKWIEEKLFRPLKMTAGTGPVGTHEKNDQPWPHGADGNPLPDNGPMADNAPSLGPAGRVHCALGEYAKFAAAVLMGGAGKKAAGLSGDTWAALLATDHDTGYGGGWNAPERDWGGGRVLTHTGSNNANYFVGWLAPARGFGVIACTNQAGEAAAAACDEVCSALIRRQK